MRGLRRGMDDDGHVFAVLLEKIQNRLLIADVDVAVPVARERRFEALSAPDRARFLAKELAAHVIVDPDDLDSLFGEESRGFGPDETRRARDNRNSHSARLILVSSRAPRDVRAATRKYHQLC